MIQNGDEKLDFPQSRLSENYRVDWDGAKALILSIGLLKSLWVESSYIVRSRNNPNSPYSVSYCKARYSIKCNCPRYQYHA